MELGDITNFQTPYWVIALMVQEIPKGTRVILEPTPGRGDVVSQLKNHGYFPLYPDGDYFEMPHAMKYDAAVGNPPFSPMKKGYEILYDIMGRTDLIILVMPWLTLINGQKRLNDILAYGLKKIIHLPRSAFKGARVQTCIIVMEKGFMGETVFTAASDVVKAYVDAQTDSVTGAAKEVFGR